MSRVASGRRLRSIAIAFAALLTGLLGAGPFTTAGAAADPYEGFGAVTRGGADGAVVRVTNLNDSGPGSLRQALADGHRTIVFAVAGEIRLESRLYVDGPFITIDGSTAPPPGITLRHWGLAIYGYKGAHDVIVTGLRIRDATEDGITIGYGAYNVVVDHVSIHGSADGNLDITEDSHDITVSWSILAAPALQQKNMLLKYNPARVTLHHNALLFASQRNPQVRIDERGTPARDTTLDMRNNLVWDWIGGYGTLVWFGPRANIVDNFYSSPDSDKREQAAAILVRNGGRAYVAGNVSPDPMAGDINAVGTETTPFPAPPVTTQAPCEAAHAIVNEAGARPLDDLDVSYLEAVTLPCPPPRSSPPGPPAPPDGPPGLPDLAVSGLSLPGGADAGDTVAIDVTTENVGIAAAGRSATRLTLSTGRTPLAADLVLGTVDVPPLSPGQRSAGTVTAPLPANLAPGSYHVVAQADATAAVTEEVETNNLVAAPLPIARPGTATAGPDLLISRIGMPGRAGPGERITVRLHVRNTGDAPAAASHARVSLSRDEREGGDVPLATVAVPEMPPGGVGVVPVRVVLPATVGSGPWFVIVAADARQAVQEMDEGNNVATRLLKIVD
jgi:hypothetical protein